MSYIPRQISNSILECHKYYPVIVVSGPRQTGKTTLCRHLFPEYRYYNLEESDLRLAVKSDPRAFLKSCGDTVIFDEAQRVPELFSYIMSCADEEPNHRFILTGRTNYLLMESVSQSLAGSAAVFTLLPFSLAELSKASITRETPQTLLGGFFPGNIVKGIPPNILYSNYITTYLERDVRLIKEVASLTTFQKFIRLIAGRAGTEFNASAIMSQLGISSPTAKSWLQVLETSYIVFMLPPYYSNINKRLVKTPKVYFTDCGLLCHLLAITTLDQLEVHPLRGQIFENMVVCEFLKNALNSNQTPDICFYKESSSHEIDLMKSSSPLKWDIFEIKSSQTFNPGFMTGLSYLRKKIGDTISSSRLIYDGPNIPPDILNYQSFFTQ